jgi:hypothetical protein
MPSDIADDNRINCPATINYVNCIADKKYCKKIVNMY